MEGLREIVGKGGGDQLSQLILIQKNIECYGKKKTYLEKKPNTGGSLTRIPLN